MSYKTDYILRGAGRWASIIQTLTCHNPPYVIKYSCKSVGRSRTAFSPDEESPSFAGQNNS